MVQELVKFGDKNAFIKSGYKKSVFKNIFEAQVFVCLRITLAINAYSVVIDNSIALIYMTLVFKKNANFCAKIWQTTSKIVIETSTPGGGGSTL
jgi:hypothetical protein